MASSVTTTTVAADGRRPDSGDGARGDIDLTRGLSDEEAARRLARDGTNTLPEPRSPSLALRLVAQLRNPAVALLMVAAVITGFLGATRSGEPLLERFGDTMAIAAVVLLNAVLGVMQERKAESALQALRQLSVGRARVRRGGTTRDLSVAEVVVGDVVELEAGDAAPADARLVLAAELMADESTLTGESEPVEKSGSLLSPGEVDPERAHQIFAGTTLVRGTGLGVVNATGTGTELGRIHRLLAQTPASTTRLEARMQRFSQHILVACVVVSVALFALGYLHGGRAWHVLLLESVSFAVAIIPEGLPAVTTVTLALGVRRMAQRGVVVRNLDAIETLGGVTVLCSDKTGTLTRNEMTARELVVVGQRHSTDPSRGTPALSPQEGAVKAALLETITLCNNATLAPTDAGQATSGVGDPTELALLEVAAREGISRATLAHQVRVAEVPFDARRQRMEVITLEASGARTAHVKGSFEALAPLCTWYAGATGPCSLDETALDQLRSEVERMSRAALRVLAVARGPASDAGDNRGLTLLGLVGLSDPPREGAREAIATCHQAGVKTVMITGDHAATAVAIARELDLWREGDGVLTGPELAVLDDQTLSARVRSVRVFARVSPEQKLRIVQSLQAAGEVVAMTGDGVNDAPALHAADVGVAMGKRGTDVARQASDIVLTDDHFATLVDGLREGRAVAARVKKSAFYLMSSNAALSVAVFACLLVPGEAWLPLTPLMILCINLVTNGLPALALGFEATSNAPLGPARATSTNEILGVRDWLGTLFVGAVVGAMAIALYAWPPASPGDPREVGRTAAFALLGFSPLFHAWNCRSARRSTLTLDPVLPPVLVASVLASGAVLGALLWLPPAREVARLAPLRPGAWALVFALSAAILPIVEAAKWLEQRFFTSPRPATAQAPDPHVVRDGRGQRQE